MSNLTIFQLISNIINKANVRCVIIGGFAVNYYKVTRQTIDVDFIITREDFDKICGQFQKAGFKVISLEKVFARLGENKNYPMDVDFMFVDIDTLDKIVSDGKEMSIGKNKFMVPSVYTVIALKLHAIKYNQKLREFKDLPDIVNLIRVNKINHKTKEFRELCLKFGTEELYEKIKEGV